MNELTQEELFYLLELLNNDINELTAFNPMDREKILFNGRIQSKLNNLINRCSNEKKN